MLYWLEQIQANHRPLVGDKAFLLSQLKQQGYPVFSGFVLDNRVFYDLLERLSTTGSLLADFPSSSLHFDVNNPQSLQLVAKQSRQVILQTPLPSSWREQLQAVIAQINAFYLIIRPSLGISSSKAQDSSGILPSQLVPNQLDALELGIKKVWSGLFGAKSLFFFQKMGIKLEDLPISLLIQPVYPAIASGVGYFNNNQLHLQATWGLGYSLLQGEVNPDQYQLDLQQKVVQYQQLGEKPLGYFLKTSPSSDLNCLDCHVLTQSQQEDRVLTPDNLQKFLELAEKLKTYPNPKSIEWTISQIDSETPKIYLNQLTLLPQAEIDQLLQQIPPLEDSKTTELLGIPASSGIAVAPLYLVSEISSHIPPNSILVAKTLPSSRLPSLKTAKGIILEESGVTSHGAILARELGIPAIVGLKNAMERLKSGESMVIDGNKGKVYPPSRNQSLPPTSSNFFLEVERFNITIATQLMLNLSQGDLLESVMSLPANGIGLIRSELMLLELLQEKSLKQWLKPENQGEFEERLQEVMSQFVQAFQPKPVFYRSFGGLIEETVTSQRGTSAYLIDSQLFELELRVLRQLQQQGYHNINLILPLVRHESEVRFCQQLIKKIGLDRSPTFQLWIMAEVPSVLFLLEDYLKVGVKGIAIGTNDFAQFLLGIEREQSSENYQQLFYHPALLKALKQLIQNAKELGLSCSICGQLPVNAPPLIEKLIRWGIDSISVEAASFYPVYQAIAQAEKRICLDIAREQSTS